MVWGLSEIRKLTSHVEHVIEDKMPFVAVCAVGVCFVGVCVVAVCVVVCVVGVSDSFQGRVRSFTNFPDV